MSTASCYNHVTRFSESDFNTGLDRYNYSAECV